jgi:hypothetical protein
MIHKVPARPVLSYASENWPLSKSDERLLSIFERRILRDIFGPVEKMEHGGGGITTNCTNYLTNPSSTCGGRSVGIVRSRTKGHGVCLFFLFNEPDITGYVKVKRLKWAGHLMRTSENRIIKKIFNTKPEGTRKTRRPNLRREECVCVCVCQDIRILGVKNWRSVA